MVKFSWLKVILQAYQITTRRSKDVGVTLIRM